MTAFEMNRSDVEDAEEDFETFLANRRSQRCDPYLKNETPAASIFDGQARAQRRTPDPCHASLRNVPTQAAASSALPDPQTAPLGSSVQVEALLGTNDDYQPLDFDDLDALPNDTWFKKSPDQYSVKATGPSLFIQQHQSSTAPPLLLQNQRLTSNRRPHDQVTASEFVGKFYKPTKKAQEADCRDKTRVSTMHDVFTEPDYVNTMRLNPYTSGIFEYKAPPKEQLIGKLHRHTKTARKKPRGQGRSQYPITDNVRNTSRIHKTRPQLPKNHLSYNLSATEERCVDAGDEDPSSLTDQPLAAFASNPIRFATEPKTKVTERQAVSSSQPVQPIMNAKTGGLLLKKSLGANARRYEDGLRFLECNYETDSAHWQAMEALVRPKVNEFTERLLFEQHLDVEDFKIALEAWEVNLGLQVMLQKYIMYSSLLKTFTS